MKQIRHNENPPSLLLIHPPAAKPSEPPAGIARLAGAMKQHGVGCEVIDANIEGLRHVLGDLPAPDDTWSHRAHRHLDAHMAALRSQAVYAKPDAYRRAVADINRLLALSGKNEGIRPGLADYEDSRLKTVRSADLITAAATPERNPYYDYYKNLLWPRIEALDPTWVGISIGFLSQALCAFALIGLIRRRAPHLKIIIGGGLVTSWLQHPQWQSRFQGLVDKMIAGPGEKALLNTFGIEPRHKTVLPDYSALNDHYLSPGLVLPFSASDGCWWRLCTFCPEQAERRPFRPLAHPTVIDQLQALTRQWRPSLIHLLDNALSPALMKALAANPPGAPWYGFTRIGPPLDDPDFCRRLAASGCIMLKLGLESGDQNVLDALGKGVRLEMAVQVLNNLKQAGIATYVYLLFGTPAEDEAAALRTADFVAKYRDRIGFLNLAIFNLPIQGPEANDLELEDFYAGDMVLYKGFKHPKGWQRSAVRRFLDKRFKKDPAIQPILRRNPPIFTSNHAPFFTAGLLQRG